MGAFTGKTVLILGGSRGIGAAIVRRFVTDGANVRFTYAGSKDAAEHRHKRLERQQYSQIVLTETLSLMSFVRAAHWISRVVNAGIGVFGDAHGIKCRRY